jgi:NTE family protein
MQVFGIFEGGGAKGLAHVGAIAAAQELGVQFAGVAGASAGAIVASLIAVGYPPNALYDPITQSGLLAGRLTDLFGPGEWNAWKQFTLALHDKLSNTTPFRAWLGAPSFYRNWRDALTRLIASYGFFDSDPIEQTIDTWLRGGKINIPPHQERLLFSDLDPTKMPPLRIVASDIGAQAPIVFSREKTPDIPVARAVCASIAIPFAFRPVELEVDGELRTLVDGGLVSNFPVWIFDDARRKRATPTPTLGFRLLERADPSNDNREGPLRFMGRLLETALNANVEIHARGIDDLYTVPIEVAASTFDFDVSAQDKYSIYQAAKQQAGFFLLRDVAPRNPRVLQRMLKEATDLFVEESGLKVQLRANLTLPTSRGTLRIVAGHNMDRDADDRLEFELSASACGECWTKQEIVILDIGAYLRFKTAVPGLTKYQQALVRPTLSTIMSIPIFDPVRFSAAIGIDNPLIGILNFDSDEASVAEFEAAEDAARKAAVACGSILQARI